MSRLAVAALAALALLGACGTTRITTGRPDARIYVDGRLVGRGEAEIRQRGLPGHATIDVRTPDGVRVQRQISRSFTLTTLGSLLYMSYFGPLFMWEYPDDVAIELAAGPAWSWTAPPSGGAWDALP
jgi:hypothetical protein